MKFKFPVTPVVQFHYPYRVMRVSIGFLDKQVMALKFNISELWP